MAIPWDEIPEDALGDTPDEDECQTMRNVMMQCEHAVDQHLASLQKGLLKQQQGRCKQVEPRMTKYPVTPPKRSRNKDVQFEYQGEHWQHTKWLRQVRRLQSYCRLIASKGDVAAKQIECQALWQSILQARGFPGGFRKTWQKRSHVLPGSPVHLPAQAPDEVIANIVFQSMYIEFQALERALIAARRTHAKTRRDKDGNIIYKDLRSERALPVQTLAAKTLVNIVEVKKGGMELLYEPHHLEIGEPVQTAQGFSLLSHMNQVASHVKHRSR